MLRDMLGVQLSGHRLDRSYLLYSYDILGNHMPFYALDGDVLDTRSRRLWRVARNNQTSRRRISCSVGSISSFVLMEVVVSTL